MTAMHQPPPEPAPDPPAQPRVIRTTPPVHRWECGCQDPPVLLATWTDAGQVNIKVRDRYWHVSGCAVIQTTCPRCASEHRLDMTRLTELAKDRT
jgi:hypothetical protein